MAAPSCCPFGTYVVNLTGKEWKSADLFQMQELHATSTCQHPPLKEITLTGMRHNGEICTITPLFIAEEVTPLFAAVLYKHYEIVRYLVQQHGANVSAGASFDVVDPGEESRVGVTPLQGAFLLLHQDNVESVQMDIVSFLVECGADPSTQSFPGVGMTILHMLAGYFKIENVDVFVQLLLQHGADLKARDDRGFTPIMCAAAYNDWVPNITFLNYLLERGDIPHKDKIDALEVAAAVLLSNELNADYFQLAFEYLTRARNLRIQENFHLTPQPQSNNRAIEWFTSTTNEQDIQHHPDQFAMQSFLIRLRIFSSMSWQAVYQHVWPYIHKYYFKKLEEEDLYDQLLDTSWTMLETISRFSLQEEGIWIATVKVVRTLTNTLEDLRSENNSLYNVENLEKSLHLVSITYQNSLDDGDAMNNLLYFYNLVRLISLVAEMPSPTDSIIQSVREIVSKKGRSVKFGRTLFHTACESQLHHLPADNLLDVIKLFIQHGADPHALCKGRIGALHCLAMGGTNRRDVEATARLLLDKNGLHLDQVDFAGMTAADCYKEEHPEADVLPDWLQEGVPKLTCLSARVSQRNKIKYEKEDLPATLDPFVQLH